MSFDDAGCKYILVQPKESSTESRAQVSLKIQSNSAMNANKNQFSTYNNLPKILTVSYNKSVIVLRASSPLLGQAHVAVYVDDKDFSNKLPYHDKDRNIRIRKLTSIYTRVSIGSFFEVFFDGSRSVYIKVAKALKGNVGGPNMKAMFTFISRLMDCAVNMTVSRQMISPKWVAQ